MLSIVAKESFELSQGASAIESIIGKSMDEKDVLALLNWEYSNVTTDGGLDCLHPRGCGSFTKVMDWTRLDWTGLDWTGLDWTDSLTG